MIKPPIRTDNITMNKTDERRSGMLLFLLLMCIIRLPAQNGQSVYTERPGDSQAIYFTRENYDISDDGSTDVTEKLQQAINSIKSERNGGIVFIPEGHYLISSTIYIPEAVRLTGYGKNRPVFILKSNAKDSNQSAPGDSTDLFSMFRFTIDSINPAKKSLTVAKRPAYCGFSNIDIFISDGNPSAVAIRTDYGVHGTISHCDIHTGSGRAGILNVLNDIQDVRFLGGDYGILNIKPSPGNNVFLADTYFEGQRIAAVRTGNAALTFINMHAKGVPVIAYTETGEGVSLFMESCLFENISIAGIVPGTEDNSLTRINLESVECRNVPVLIGFPLGRKVTVGGETYRVNHFTSGQVMDDMISPSQHRIETDIETVRTVASELGQAIPALPDMHGWVNIRELGAAGDGKTDDTEIFRQAIEKYEHIYVPQGSYIITGTLKLKYNTCLIGLHPFTTQIILAESAPAFSGFGAPQPLIETAAGGTAVLSGIGINTGVYNYRATGCKWMAGEGSMMNDILFIGSYCENNGAALCSQYWSLWVTNNGGGTFKNIISNSPYAAGGLYISNTSTPGKIYGMSLEHHRLNEARFNNVTGWKIYTLRCREASVTNSPCLPVEIVGCTDLIFANFNIPGLLQANASPPAAFRLWNSENLVFMNIHNPVSTVVANEIPIYDFNRHISVFHREIAKLKVTGIEENNGTAVITKPWSVYKIATGFCFATGITADSKGNIYFCDTILKRIYKWFSDTGDISILADYPWQPISLACDNDDNLIVLFKYYPQPGYLVNGKQETLEPLPDREYITEEQWNAEWAILAYSVNTQNPDETIELLPRVSTSELKDIDYYIYPSGRWRHNFDSAVVNHPATSFISNDHSTAIPETWDLGRSVTLINASPGDIIYTSDIRLKKTVRLKVEENGSLLEPVTLFQRGEYSSINDMEGNIFVADGVIFIYGEDGIEKGVIKLDERPVSVCFGDKDKRTLFITTGSSVYCLKTAPL